LVFFIFFISFLFFIKQQKQLFPVKAAVAPKLAAEKNISGLFPSSANIFVIIYYHIKICLSIKRRCLFQFINDFI